MTDANESISLDNIAVTSTLLVAENTFDAHVTFTTPLQDKIQLGNEVKEIRFYDLNGKLIHSSTEKVVSVEELKPAIYITVIRLRNDSEISAKLLKQ